MPAPPRPSWVLLAAALLATGAGRAQEDPRAVETSAPDVALRLSGTFQPRLGFGVAGDSLARLGFGIRRARFRATAQVGGGLGVHYDAELAGGSVQSLDLYGFYRPSARWRLRAGRMAGPQPRASDLTSHVRIDAVERAAIAERWTNGTIGFSGRTFGVEGRYQTDEATLEVFVHGGDGSFDRARGQFREGVVGGDVTRGVGRLAQAVSVYAAYEPAAAPGVEVGGFAGYNGAAPPLTALDSTAVPGLPASAYGGRRYASYSAHAYWGRYPGDQPVRLKADVLGIRYESVPGVGAQHAVGVAVLAAAAPLRHGEAFARVERFAAGAGGRGGWYWAAGASYSLSARRGLAYGLNRLTLGYASAAPEAEADQHLVVLQWQVLF